MPTDGRITSQPLFTSSLTGSELFMIVSPGNAASGVNYKMPASALASYILPISNATAGLPLVSNGTVTPPSFQPLNIGTAANITGILGVPNGGTGTGSLGADGLVLGNGSAALSVVSATAAGLVLTSQGSASPPSYQSPGILAIPPTILTASATYTALATDFVILFQRTSSIATTTLHLRAGSTWANQSIVVMVLDNNATLFPVNVVPATGETISGLATAVIQNNYGGYRFVGLASGGSYISP